MTINLEQIKTNAQLMKSKGLDKKIIEISKEAYSEAEQRTAVSYGRTKTHIFDRSIAEILGIFGGSVKGINVLDLGCGNGRGNDSYNGEGNYVPILSTALAYLGANVTGVDYSSRNDKERKIVSKKWGFQYKDFDITKLLWFSESDKKIEFFKNKDLIIARSLLNYGLKNYDIGPCVTYGGLGEWQVYKEIINGVQALNKRDSVYNLEIPECNIFGLISEEIDKKNISDGEKYKEKNAYAVNEFKDTFGEIIYGEKKSGMQVFTIKEFNGN